MKKGISFIISIVVTIAFCSVTFAKGAWKRIGNNWRYENHAGSGDYVTEKFKAIYDADGVTEKVYYFDYFGNMVTGLVLINANLHYDDRDEYANYSFGEDGVAMKNGVDIDGVHYDTEGNGKVLGLPIFFDIYKYPSVYTVGNNIAINSGQTNFYDDKNNITPTAPAGN